ncbi:MAG: hypothetical protein LUD01_07475, partial [Clostridiales bacterium]|nr:hypothetical protein [Clostridiales bacterium]
MDSFSNRLNSVMKEKNYKQIDVILLANQAGAASGVHIGKSHMSQYCSGKTVPRADILRVLAQVLEVNPLWLQGGDVPRDTINTGNISADTKKSIEEIAPGQHIIQNQIDSKSQIKKSAVTANFPEAPASEHSLSSTSSPDQNRGDHT